MSRNCYKTVTNEVLRCRQFPDAAKPHSFEGFTVYRTSSLRAAFSLRSAAVVLASLVVCTAGCSRRTRQIDAASTDGSGGAAVAEARAGDRTVLQNKGSDTLVNVAQAWAEAYKTVDPNVAIAVSGGGSGTGISALINGTVDLANSSRKIEPKEVEAATKNGVTPVEFTVGHDALAIFVHRNNPLKEITAEQLVEIYAEGGKADTWSALGVKVPGCDGDKIIRLSRQNNSGTYAYFKEAVLKEREFKFGSTDLHGSKDVVDTVQKTPCAIGYSGLAYATPELAMPCVRMGEQCITPTVETASNGSYPISRPLFMYTKGQPRGSVKTYLDWILSDKGQCIIAGKGYAPIRKLTCP
jgi:phosphate transport system substrate-binding protein